MAFELRITDLGRAALADGANRGTNAIRLTKMVIGDGSGPGGAADDGRTALRNQRGVAALDGTSTVSGRIAVRGVFNPAAAYGVSELGLLGRVGQGAEELYAYWTDGGTLLASTVAATRLVIAGSLDIAPAAAEVTVTVSSEVSLGDPTLSATVTAVGARVDAIEAADFAAQVTALTGRVAALEAGGDSVIRSIQRGSVTIGGSGSSASINTVDRSKAFLNLLTMGSGRKWVRLSFGSSSRISVSQSGATDSSTLSIGYEVIEYE